MKDSYVFYMDKLEKEYLEAFGQIEMYVQSQGVDDNTKEERLGELLDIFLSASATGKSVKKITGNDMEQFCKTFCSDFGVKNRVLFLIDWFKSIAKVLIFVSVLDLIFPEPDVASVGGDNLWNHFSSLNISGYFIGIIVAGLFAAAVNIVLRRMMFKQKQVSMKILKAASVGGAVVSFIIIYFSLSLNTIRLFECPVWIVLAVSGIYLCLYELLRGRHIKREKVKFFDLVLKESSSEFAREMEKKYERARKKSVQRGKGELSLEAFLEKEEKDINLTEKMGALYYIFPVVITGAAFFITFCMGGFESNIDAAVYIAIMLTVQYPIMLSLWKLTKSGVKERRTWIAKKRGEDAESY